MDQDEFNRRLIRLEEERDKAYAAGHKILAKGKDNLTMEESLEMLEHFSEGAAYRYALQIMKGQF